MKTFYLILLFSLGFFTAYMVKPRIEEPRLISQEKLDCQAKGGTFYYKVYSWDGEGEFGCSKIIDLNKN